MKFGFNKIGKYTKIQMLSYVKMRLRNDESWAIAGCLTIYKNQTRDEQDRHLSIAGSNGKGFDRVDTPMLTAIARKLRQRHPLKDYEINLLKNKMPKYAGQLIRNAQKKNNGAHLKKYLDAYYQKGMLD